MAREKRYGASKQFVDLGPDNVRLEIVAQDVAIDRARAIAESMCHMAAIRSLQTKQQYTEYANVTCSAAKVQDTTAESGQQAAHLLPGQIKVNNQSVWQLCEPSLHDRRLRNDLIRLELTTMNCFAETNVLPAIFNRADSQAEKATKGGGLKDLFAESVGKLWKESRVDSIRPLAIDASAVRLALNHWFRHVSEIYEAASKRKLEARNTAVRQASAKAEERELESRVLEAYYRSCNYIDALQILHKAGVSSIYRRYEHIR